MTLSTQAPLIMHIVFRFGVGGLENGLVNLINTLPRNYARHCIVSLTDIDRKFADRLQRQDVELIPLEKPPGQTYRIFPRLYREMRQRKPDIVHTRNIAALETQVIAWLARTPIRVHGEHGWDVNDLHGSNRHYQTIRKFVGKLVNHQIALSSRTKKYLVDIIGIDSSKVSAILNGVDSDKFEPQTNPEPIQDWPFQSEQFVVGTIGRLAKVKNQILLCRAFLAAREHDEHFRRDAKLLIVGDGPDRPELEQLIKDNDMQSDVWFCGEQNNVTPFFKNLDLFCLPSLAEGISNSILEAMSCGLPVVATDVGGNSELVRSGVTGELVNTDDPEQLAQSFLRYFHDKRLLRLHGEAGRQRVLDHFTLAAMSSAYQNVYTHQLSHRRGR